MHGKWGGSYSIRETGLKNVSVPGRTGVGVPGGGGLEYLGEVGWSTWERGVGVPGIKATICRKPQSVENFNRHFLF